jgi:hypothetical protein
LLLDAGVSCVELDAELPHDWPTCPQCGDQALDLVPSTGVCDACTGAAYDAEAEARVRFG